MNNTLYVDPSIANFGYCVSVDDEIVDYGHKRTYSKYPLHDRVLTIKETLTNEIIKYEVDDLVYEYPDKGKYHPTGVQTFLRLGVAIGAVLGLHSWENVYQYTPKEWKGGRPKSETALLVKSKGFNDVEDNNTIDSLGLYIHHNESIK